MPAGQTAHAAPGAEIAMHSHFDVTSFAAPQVPPASHPEAVADLLRQLLEVQKQTLAQLQASAAAQDPSGRWRALMARWAQHFPELPQSCKKVLPTLERAYGAVVAALVEELHDRPEDHLDNEFTLQDFLDRYGMRLGQLGNVLNLVAPLAEAGSQNESS